MRGNKNAMKDHLIVIYSNNNHSSALIEGCISSLRCRIRRCDSAQQVMEVCRHENPTLVIMLCYATLLNGSEILQHIRPARQRRPAIYVISWQLQEQMVLSLLEIGIDQYMTFPLSLQRLRNKVTSLLL